MSGYLYVNACASARLLRIDAVVWVVFGVGGGVRRSARAPRIEWKMSQRDAKTGISVVYRYLCMYIYICGECVPKIKYTYDYGRTSNEPACIERSRCVDETD